MCTDCNNEQINCKSQLSVKYMVKENKRKTVNKVTRKNFLAIISCMFLVAILSGALGYSLADQTWVPPNIALDDFPSNPTFVVKVDNTTSPVTYYAVASNGSICYQSQNLGTMMNNLLAAGSGGLVEFTTGTFSLSKTIVIPDGKVYHFKGAGVASPIQTGNQAQGTYIVMNANSNCDAFIYNGSSEINWLSFESLSIFGSYSNNSVYGVGININNHAKDGLIFNCYINGFRTNCVSLNNSWNWRLIGTTFEFAQNYGVCLIGGADAKISDCKFLYNTNGLYVGADSVNIQQTFFYNNTHYGIYTKWNRGNIILGNIFQGSSHTNPGIYSDIYVTGTVNTIIANNNFFGVYEAKNGISFFSGTNTSVTGNSFLNYTDVPIYNLPSDASVDANIGYSKEYTAVYLPIASYSFTWTSATWDSANQGLLFDKRDYPSGVNLTLVASIRTSAGVASLKLYDYTNNLDISGSTISTSYTGYTQTAMVNSVTIPLSAFPAQTIWLGISRQTTIGGTGQVNTIYGYITEYR
jgi:hypothetical protein